MAQVPSRPTTTIGGATTRLPYSVRYCTAGRSPDLGRGVPRSAPSRLASVKRFTIGLALHPTRTADDSITTITDFADQHGIGLVARLADASRAGCPGLDDAGFARSVDDVVLGRAPGTSAVAALEVGGACYGYYRADAVVVATPTGSTAYSYAAGGPVVSPSAPVVVVTPVAPMSGISRSLVFGGPDTIGLATDDVSSIDVDGVAVPDAPHGVRLQLDAGQVVRLDAARHDTRRRIRLSLLDLPLRPDQLLELVPADLRDRSLLRRETAPPQPPLSGDY